MEVVSNKAIINSLFNKLMETLQMKSFCHFKRIVMESLIIDFNIYY